MTRLSYLLASWLLVAPLVMAQNTSSTPTVQGMIDSLKPNADDNIAPKTRSLAGRRNLTVDATSQDEASKAAAERPSLSLQIQFDFDSTRVKPESQLALANLAAALQSKELIEAKFAIEGHTDARGKTDYNQRLSQHRADAVRELLINKGVDGTRLAATGKGASDPANKDDPQAAENRRVRVVNVQ